MARSNGNSNIQNVYTFSNLRKVIDPTKELDMTKDMLVINRPWGDSAASRSQMKEQQFLLNLRDLIEGLYNSGDIINVTIAPELDENVLEIREVSSLGKVEYFISSKINGVPLDQYLADTFLTIDDTLTEDIVSNGVGVVGGVDPGYTFTTGMSFTEILRKIFQKANPAVYNEATIGLSTVQSTIVEVGIFFAAPLTLVFTQNDSGPATQAEFLINGVVTETQNLPGPVFNYTAPSVKLTSDGANIFYQGQIDHDQGAQKTDNFGNPSGDPAVEVPARVDVPTNVITIIARRRIFYDKNLPVPTNSAEVRALTSSQFSIYNTFTISVVPGDTSVVFAIPSNKTVTSVIFVGTLISNETSIFLDSETIVAVTGADPGQDLDNYKVYSYIPAIPFGSSADYNITLS